MPAYGKILESNALISDATAPRVAVFVGGTAGIGKFTLEALVATDTHVKIYLVGRKSAAETTRDFIKNMKASHPHAEIIWTEAEASLLSETKRVCEEIRTKETHVDLLFLTAGYAPWGARNETAEGLDVSQSLSFYSRMLVIEQLLPLLNKAEAPRVISVLGGGMERVTSLNQDDLGLTKPGNFRPMTVQAQNLTMNTVYLDKLSSLHPNITFVHSWPGSVNTGNVRRGLTDPNSLMGWVISLIMEPIIWLVSMSNERSGQRHLFECTSAMYGGRGVPWDGPAGLNAVGEAVGGLFLVNWKADCTPNTKVVNTLRETAREKVWEHTQETLKPYM